MTRRILAAAALALALPAPAQSVPAANFTDMWWNPSESGWGLSILQHAATNQVYAVWYHYDPRTPDVSTTLDSTDYKPLWIVMSGGTWTTPTTVTGPAYITNGTPFFQAGSSTVVQSAGTFTLSFSDARNGTFSYSIAPPSNASGSDPAAGLPVLSASKAIQRQSF